MDTLDLADWVVKALIIGTIMFCFLVPIIEIGKTVGETQVVGYVVNVEQASWPWPNTHVTFTIEHPTSIVDAHYFDRTYAGHHEFALHQRYRITANRDWFEW